MSPFWDSVSLENGRHDAAIGPNGEERRVLGRSALKKGWYETCLYGDGYGKRVREGVRALLEEGFAGLFIDNVVHRSPCRHVGCPGCGDDPDPAQRSLLERLSALVREIVPDGIVAINAGRWFLLDPFPAADFVIVENFAFGDRSSNDGSFLLASRTFDSPDEMVAATRTMADRVEATGTRLVGYTKVDRRLPRVTIAENLELAQDLASRSGVLWTTRLKRFTTGRPWVDSRLVGSAGS